MSLLAQLKSNAVAIAAIVAVLAVGSSLYEHFFSDKAREIRELKSQIEQAEEQIAALKQEYQKLNEEEKQRLDQIAALKERLDQTQETIQQNEVNLDEIKNTFIDVDSALAVLEQHTRSSVSRGRSVLSDLGAGN
ncbi:MAG: hypothetical protein HUU32_01000 [Calditrichaceae bacterium]|nr:hypothetical protein [Calditrichia bacterium]NUQ39951.1 hypothetical protein [Calditrichaceae bacterium]